MNDKFFDMIDDYINGDCSNEDALLFEKHLDSCSKCKEEYELALSVNKTLSSFPTISPPDDFLQKLNDKLDFELEKEEKKKKYFTKIPIHKYSAVAACVVLVASLGVDVVKISDSSVTDNTIVPTETSLPQESNIPSKNTDVTDDIELSTTEPTTSPEVSRRPTTTPTKAQPTQKAKKSDIYVTPSPAEQHTPTSTTAPKAPVSKVQPTTLPQPTPTEHPTVANSEIPSYMDPKKQVVLASAVENEYKTSGISTEDLPVKKRDLQAEFALLESNSKSGSIIANPATLASLDSIGVVELEDSRHGADKYGDGRGSLFISSKDKETVSALIEKYASNESNHYYYLTGDNFKSFTEELSENGISYKKRLISQDGSNVAFQVVFS